MEQNPVVNYPFGPATVIQLGATGETKVEVQNALTILDGATVQATGARTVNVAAIANNVPDGARIVLLHKSAATETMTFGTNMAGKQITGVSGKTFATELVLVNGKFYQTAEAVQVD